MERRVDRDPNALNAQVAAVTRELRMRRQVFPKLVENARMTKAEADYEIKVFDCLLLRLNRLLEEEQKKGRLI